MNDEKVRADIVQKKVRELVRRRRIELLLCFVVISTVIYICIIFNCCADNREKTPASDIKAVETFTTPSPVVTSPETTVNETVIALTSGTYFDKVYYPHGDPNNYVYPYNTLNVYWDVNVYNEGFRYYRIPDEYQLVGGCLPEVIQVYLWDLCRQRGLDYYIMLAVIEKESSYHWDAFREGDDSVGYFQVIEYWHEDRIAEEHADIYNPYGNIRVGINFMDYLYDKYGDWNKALMAYNMGEYGAISFWEDGLHSTLYSRSIIERAQEIKEIIQG